MSLRNAVHTMFLKSLRATLAVLFAVAVGSSQASNTNGNIAGQILEAGKTAAVSGAMVTVTNDAQVKAAQLPFLQTVVSVSVD